MANTKKTDGGASKTSFAERVRRWMRPSKRASGYAEERKAKVHKRGDKEGEPLDDYNKGLRSGYLLCQSDHAGSYIYDKALKEGKSKEEARAESQKIGAHRKNGGNN